jgi:hypothetical protein
VFLKTKKKENVMGVFRVDDGCDQGANLGKAGGKIGFFDATPVVKQTAPTVITLSITGDVAADSTALRNAVNAIRTAGVNLGLVA